MQRTATRSALCAAVLMLAATGALAQNDIYQCQDQNGKTMLTDKPCDTLASTQLVAPPPTERLVVKEHYTLPQTEWGRERWAGKPPASAPPKVDVATLRAARLALDLQEKVASAR